MADEATCRHCGVSGEDVAERMARFPNEAERMALCDYCACIGAVCAGKHPRVADLSSVELINLIRTGVQEIVAAVTKNQSGR